MSSDIRFKYYDFYIKMADNEVLELLKKDIAKDKTAQILNAQHYARLTRSIVRRRKELKNEEEALKTVN